MNSDRNLIVRKLAEITANYSASLYSSVNHSIINSSNLTAFDVYIAKQFDTELQAPGGIRTR